MTPLEIYKLKPESETFELYNLENHLKNEIEEWKLREISSSDQKSVKIKILKDFCFDGRRTWTLCTVWFENNPVMIIQNAGREGDDHQKRFITNKDLFKKMVNFLLSIIPSSDEGIDDDLIDENKEDARLTHFYGNELTGIFERY